MPKTRKPKPRNPIAKAVKQIRPKVKPNKKKNYPVPGDIPSTGNTTYNTVPLFSGD